MIKKLRIKFICANMAIVLVMLTAALTTVLVFTHHNLERNAVTFMQEITANPLMTMTPGDSVPGGHFPFFSLEIGAADEIVVLSSGSYNLEDPDILRELAARSVSSGDRSGLLPEYGLRYYRMVLPTSQRIVFTDASGELSTMNTMVRYCLLIGAASMIVFFFISLGLSRWAIRPVDEAWKQQKRFVSDASHELKTPLTVIALNAELLESTFCQDGQLQQDRIGHILQGVERMRSLVESLLELARTDSGLPRKQMSDVNLSEVISLGALSAEALFLEKHQQLTVDAGEDIHICGSARHMEQLLTIFLDNARKYGDEGGTVSVTLSRYRARCCLLCVRNTGAPIPKEKLRRIFDRFYRLDEARVSGGYGLGLSIAEGIVREHRGRIWAVSEGGENSFYVKLPLRSRSSPGKFLQKMFTAISSIFSSP